MLKSFNLKSFALGAGLAISALGIYAVAAALNTFASGDVVSSSKINANFAGLNADVAAVNAKFPVATADLADSAVSTAKIANGAVTAAKVADEPGFNTISTAAGGALAISGTPTSTASITLTAPAAGFAMVTANFNWLANHTTGTNSTADFSLSKTVNALGTLASAQRVIIPGSQPTSSTLNFQQSVALSEVFAVTTGDNTFFLNTQVVNGAGQFIGQVKMTVIYLPTRYGTGATVN